MVIYFAIVEKSCALFCVIGVIFKEIALELKLISHHNFVQVFPIILISVAFLYQYRNLSLFSLVQI